MLLNNEGKKDFLKSRFHQYFDITLKPLGDANIEHFVNFTLSLNQINDLYDLSSMEKFFNEGYNNIIFTSQDNANIYDYEFYKGFFYIRIKPFSNIVRMHIIPKKYDASNTLSSNPILIFKDSDIEDLDFSCTENYERLDKEEKINLYYKLSQIQDESGLYKFDIRNKTRDMKNLQINAGFAYNDTDPNDKPLSDTNHTYHFLGITDESDEHGNEISESEFTEFNDSLLLRVNRIENGRDEIVQTNHVKDFLNTPSSVDSVIYDIDSTTNSMKKNHERNELYHIQMKYFNDNLYVEEDGDYIIQDWRELDG